jgi:hypothetical protein
MVSVLSGIVVATAATIDIGQDHNSAKTGGPANALAVIEIPTAKPALAVSDVVVPEGDVGDTKAIFTVTLTGSTDSLVTVDFSTVAGTASAPADFAAAAGTLTFAPGERSKTVEVRVNGDAVVEGNESFQLLLTNAANADLADTFGAGVILNDDFVPGQLAGFRWDAITGSPKVGEDIPVRLTAVDGGGNPVTNFNGTVQLMATPTGRRPSSVVITEVNPVFETQNQVEFGNVSTNEVNLSNWTVSFYDSTTWPLPRGSVTLDAGTLLPAAGVFRITEGTNSTKFPFLTPDLFPNLRSGFPLEWEPSAGENARHIAVLLQDSTGAIVDFFCAMRALPNQITVPVAIPADEWDGLPMVNAASLRETYQRSGNTDTDSAADWTTWGPSPNQISQLMRVPFVDSRALPMTPGLATEFRNGVWTGSIRLNSFAPRVAFLAAVGNGRWDRSPQFSMDTDDNVSVTLAVSPKQGSQIGDFVRYRAEVTHCCDVVSSNVVVELRLPIAFGRSGFLFDVQMSQGTYETTTYLGTGGGDVGIGTLVRVRFGDLAPGQGAFFDFAKLPQNNLRFLPMPTNVVATAKVTRTRPEANVADDSTEAVMELNTGCVRLPAGAFAWWRGEQTLDDSLAAAALEIVGRNTNSPTYSPGRMEGAMSLTTDRGRGFQTGEGFQWNLGANRDFTVEFWMRTTSDILRDRIVLLDRREATSGVGFVLVLDQGRLGVTLTDTDGKTQSHFTRTPTTKNPDLRDGRWHHLALSVRRDPQDRNLLLAIDGNVTALSSGLTVTGDLGNAPLRIGFEGGAGTETALVGLMDEITLYHTALDSTALASISRAGSAGKCLAIVSLTIDSPRTEGFGFPNPISYGRPVPFTLWVTNQGPLAIPATWVGVDFTGSGSVQFLSPTVNTNKFSPRMLRPLATYFDLGPLGAGNSRSFEVAVTLTNFPVNLWAEWRPGILNPGQGYSMGFDLGYFRINPDGDADGTDDRWELTNGFDPLNAADAMADTDGDGSRNVDEFKLGTNPRNATDVLKLELHAADANGVRFRFPGKTGKSYGLLRRDQLDGPWTEVTRVRANRTAVAELADTNPPAEAAFYQIQLLPNP